MLWQELQISELGQEEMREVLRRAQELEWSSRAVTTAPGDLESFLSAAEEAGISREAVLQALRERLGNPIENVAPGEKVFAKSAAGDIVGALLMRLLS